MGLGNYWRNSHEFVLIATRGKAKRFNEYLSQPSHAILATGGKTEDRTDA